MPERVRVPVLDTRGLAAWADGTRTAGGALAPPRDRKGRLNARRVDLALSDETPSEPVALPPADEAWLLAADSRAWSSVAARFGEQALDVAVRLVQAGAVTLTVPVLGTAADLAAPVRWRLTAEWAALAAARKTGRADAAQGRRDRAHGLAEQVRPVDDGLADALAAARGHEPTLPVLLAAASDLLDGTAHDGPRAFSQAHFGDTKARDDAPAILTAAGTGPQALAALGLTRSPYLGLGGAVAVTGTTGERTDLWQFPGPVRFRVPPEPGDLTAELAPDDRTVTLAVVENLQAAETACDAHGLRLAVAWCAGQPADRPLDLIAGLAARAARVLICTDADWGGVRIAARVADALPPGTDFEVLDPGTAPHEPREPFSTRLREQLGFMGLSAPHEQVREFARAVLDRGYPVEQEASARAVLAHALR